MAAPQGRNLNSEPDKNQNNERIHQQTNIKAIMNLNIFNHPI